MQLSNLKHGYSWEKESISFSSPFLPEIDVEEGKSEMMEENALMEKSVEGVENAFALEGSDLEAEVSVLVVEGEIVEVVILSEIEVCEGNEKA